MKKTRPPTRVCTRCKKLKNVGLIMDGKPFCNPCRRGIIVWNESFQRYRDRRLNHAPSDEDFEKYIAQAHEMLKGIIKKQKGNVPPFEVD